MHASIIKLRRTHRHYCATSRKGACSFSDYVIGIFHWLNPSGRTMALRSTQPLREMSARKYFLRGKGDRCAGLTNLPLSCADCLESWEPQPPGTLKACPGLSWNCFTITFLHFAIITGGSTNEILWLTSSNVLVEWPFTPPVTIRTTLLAPRILSFGTNGCECSATSHSRFTHKARFVSTYFAWGWISPKTVLECVIKIKISYLCRKPKTYSLFINLMCSMSVH
jgi:hypothetical protein